MLAVIRERSGAAPDARADFFEGRLVPAFVTAR